MHQVNDNFKQWRESRKCKERSNESRGTHQNGCHARENNKWQTRSEVHQDLVEVIVNGTWKKIKDHKGQDITVAAICWLYKVTIT